MKHLIEDNYMLLVIEYERINGTTRTDNCNYKQQL